MAEKVITNKQGVLQWRDLAKSWVMLVIFPILQTVIEVLGKEAIDWVNIAKATGLATIVFLGQRMSAPPAVVTTYSTNDKAVEVAKDIQDAK